MAAPWHFAYGENELLPYGRIAAYFAAVDRDAVMLDAARRVGRAAAEKYARLAVERYWRQEGENGLFVRLPGDRYYEAKTGVGFVLAGLVRLGGVTRGDWRL